MRVAFLSRNPSGADTRSPLAASSVTMDGFSAICCGRFSLLMSPAFFRLNEDHRRPCNQCGNQEHPEECLQECRSHHREEKNSSKDTEPPAEVHPGEKGPKAMVRRVTSPAASLFIRPVICRR